ncbi:MAG: hypothetical protein GX804_02040 [Lentisphaerae bacterium]|nr:hypothetical protein [Lentisphaerota bacterium]
MKCAIYKHGSMQCHALPVPVENRRSGQALVESLIVIFILSLFLFGLLQVAIAYNGRLILHHAAARAARSRAVGFNEWMALKAQRVASIPNSGEMIFPDFAPTGTSPLSNVTHPGETINLAFRLDAGISPRAAFERVRIPAYLDSDNHARAEYVLNYEEWERGAFSHSERSSALGRALTYEVAQEFPLKMPMMELIYPFGRRDEQGFRRISMAGEATAGRHSDLYLE